MLETIAAVQSAKSPFTRTCRTSALKRILTELWEFHGAQKYQTLVGKQIAPAPRNVTATAEEREAIIRAAPPHLRVWLLLCSDLAMRSGTAATIAPIHYDPERREISFRTKFKSTQTLPVTDAIAELFEQTTGSPDTPYVIGLRQRRHKQPSKQPIYELREEFRRLRKAIGITRKLTAHDLRRTTAVRTLEITADLRVVQALLGHRHLATTLYYLDHRNTPVPVSVLEAAKLNARKEPRQ